MKKLDNILICNMYLSGLSMNQIKNQLNCHQWEVWEILKNNNIKSRPKYLWDRKNYSKHTLNFTYFDNIDSQEKAYFLGFIWSDVENILFIRYLRSLHYT